MLAPPLRDLVEAARWERGRLVLDSPEREYYLGVEVAAEGMLRPETLAGRTEDWLEHESNDFRDGYLAAVAEIVATVSNGRVPLRLDLPRRWRAF